MAVRIPTYERHVQLDSGAQTIPRFSADLTAGKGLKEAGSALASVAAHWKTKQESFDKLQLHQNYALLKQQIIQIQAEEALKFDPAKDTLGAYHDRVQQRVAAAVADFQAKTPASQSTEARIIGNTTMLESGNTAAYNENHARNEYGKKQLDTIAGQVNASVLKNPDSIHDGLAQIRKAINDLGPISGLTDAQKRILEEGYINGLVKNAAQGFANQGRQQVGQEVLKQFYQDRRAEDAARVNGAATGTEPKTPAPAQPAKPATVQPGKQSDAGDQTTPQPQARFALFSDKETGTVTPQVTPVTGGSTDQGIQTPPEQGAPQQGTLNQSRIAAIDAKPEIKAAIEKVAAETGTDPNLLKVAASIESDGRADAKTGSHQGLFQLTKAEFGMHNGGKGDINNPEDNARAFVNVLERNKDLLTKAIGREPTPEELYLSHNQGVAGTVAHIQNPDQPAWKTLLATPEGQNKGEAWAKSAVKGNVPADVLKRLYGGDETRVSSRDFTAIKGTQVAGGDIDTAVTNANKPAAPAQGTVVASADGSVVSDTRPPAYVGGVNIGGPAAPVTTYPQYRGGGAKLDESGAHGYTRGGVSVAPWLVDTVREASKTLPEGYTAKVISTVDSRATGTRWHPTGRAIDIQIYDDKGRPVPNTGGPNTPGWSIYENMAAAAKAIAQDKHGQDMTWGGHFNTGTPYDRMHFQVGGQYGGGSARSFTPEQIDAGRTAYQAASTGTTQVAGPGAPTGASSRWDIMETTTTNLLNGSSMKAASMAHSMKVAFTKAVNTDVETTQLNGKGITLSKELQTYYKTPSGEITYDMIANQLGPEAAEKWKEGKDYSQKVYNGGAHLEDMPRSAILERLQQLKPDDTSPYYDDQKKVYDAVLKKAAAIEKDRNADPAGYADKDPVVAQALKDARENPQDETKTQALITARMKRQDQLGIDPALRTPITNNEAKILAQPLLNRARPDRDTAGVEVANNIVKFIGRDQSEIAGIPNLQQRALETVLKQKGITDQQAAATADALVAAQQPPPAPLTRSQFKGWSPTYTAKDGYYDPMSGLEMVPPTPSDNYADPPDAATGGRFVPGQRFIPASHIEMLLKDPSLADVFDRGSDTRAGYGEGAAAHFLGGGKNVPTTSPLVTPTDEEQTLMPAPVIPAQPDALTAPDDQDQTDQAGP